MGCNPDDYSKLSETIRKFFTDCSDVSAVSNAPDGVNAACHLVAKTTDGERFGLKLFNGTKTANGADLDKLVADLALIVKAPNACPVVQTREISFIPVFNSSDTVNLTHWLSNSVSVKNIPPSAQEDIKNDGQGYYEQLGEWLAFGLLFGISDRHEGNWVWNSTENRLAMIDLEFALQPGVTLNHYNPVVEKFLSEKSAVVNTQLNKLFRGFMVMWEKLVAQKSELAALLKKNNFSSSYSLDLLTQEPEALILPYIDRYRF